MNKKKAVVAGHICIDITPMFPGQPVVKMEEVLAPGKLIHMDGVDIHTGGAVANTGLAMKKLGTDVSLMGKIGNDAFGQIVLHILEQYDAGKAMIVSENSATSYSVVLAVPGIDRVFLHDPGANDTFTRQDLDMDTIAQAALFHFGYPPLMREMYQKEGEELAAMLRQVKAVGTAVSLDMAAIDPASAAAGEDWYKILEKVLPYVDFFVPSVEELCFMLDRQRYDSWMVRAGGKDVTEILTLEDIAPLADEVLQLGAKVALIKCGAPGIYYKTAPKERMQELCERMSLCMESWAQREGFEHSYKPEIVRSGTGAGDTSIAAFLTSVLQEESLETALQMATATGACCVASYDALSGLKPFDELKEKIKRGWEKYITIYGYNR